MKITVSELWIYPLKSAAGIRLKRAGLDAFGLQMDRRWMLVGLDNRFLSQRKLPQMALLETSLEGNQLTVRRRDQPQHKPLVVTPPTSTAETCSVTIWDDTCTARLAHNDAHAWFSQALSHPCRLVFMPQSTHRQVDPRYAREGDRAAFSDGFPLLLISEGSLHDLNQRLDDPIEMDRFRPNIVVAGCTPYAEDRWQQIRFHGEGSQLDCDVVKPCSRCMITTTNQATAERTLEPLRTLATYRCYNSKVLFGQNIIHRAEGELVVGQTLEVVASGTPTYEQL